MIIKRGIVELICEKGIKADLPFVVRVRVGTTDRRPTDDVLVLGRNEAMALRAAIDDALNTNPIEMEPF